MPLSRSLPLGRGRGLPNVTASPTELFATASGLPLLLTLAVLLLHLACCAVQGACGASDVDDADSDAGGLSYRSTPGRMATPKEEVDAIATGMVDRGVEPLIPS